MTGSGPEDILATYESVARAWGGERDSSGYEHVWLARLVGIAPGRSALDLGCGSGTPIATWLEAAGMRVTGVDGAAAMCGLFAETLPDHTCHHADMRGLDLGARFDAILAWNSFFHLSAADQRDMFATFAAHAAPGAALLFTSGPAAGEGVGAVAGQPVYHASLDPSEYRDLLAHHGFAVLDFVPEDPECRGHSVWLARYGGVSGGP
jgi:SAM-dependent methyltransferase